MNTFFKLIYLILIAAFHLSCFEKKAPKKEVSTSEIISVTKIDTLKFTSGIRTIIKDSKGNYWIGSHQEGVVRYNGESFEYFTIKEGLSHNQVRSIQEDKNGNIWFGTAYGVSSYDGKKITNHTAIINSDSQSEWRKTDNDLWFNAGNNEGVYRYDGQKLDYLAFPSAQISSRDGLYFTTGITNGQNGMLWIATYVGVFGYNGNEFTIINNETLGLNNKTFGPNKDTGLLHIRSILEDSSGRLWIGNNGIGVLLKEGDTTINFSEKYNLIHPTSSRSGAKSQPSTLEHVFAIEEDSDGNIWFGDRDTGAWKFDGKTMTNYMIDKKLKSQMIWDIYEDQNKNLLVAMAEGGVYQFNGKSFDKRF